MRKALACPMLVRCTTTPTAEQKHGHRCWSPGLAATVVIATISKSGILRG